MNIALRVCVVGVGATGAFVASASGGWYGGDPAPYSPVPLAAFHWDTGAPTPGYEAFAFDNFAWTGAGGGVVDVVGGHYSTFGTAPITGVTTAAWQIRSGVSAGNGGTLVASGVGAATLTPTAYLMNLTGNGVPAYPVSLVTMDVPNFSLAPGNYWFAMSIGDAGVGASGFVVGTTGSNGVGGPLGDSQCFYFQGDGVNPPGWNWVDVDQNWNTTMDISYFINEVPGPGAGMLLGLGGVMAMRRRTRRAR